jgi:ribosomal protein L35
MSGKLMNQSPKQKRKFSKEKSVDASLVKRVNRLLGRR